MHNTVYAYDAESASAPLLLWHANLGTPVPSNRIFSAYADISPEVGILATPAIDPAAGVIYIVSEVIEDNSPQFYLHALDLLTGEDRFNGPARIDATVPGTAPDALNGNIAFDAKQHLQRSGLLLANHSVYIGFGSHADEAPWHGWVISYDATDLTKQNGAFLATSSTNGAAIWQSGRGLAADDAGNVYLITGNGAYDGVKNFGESFLKLAGPDASLSDWFTPNDWSSLSESDTDLSAGPALVPGTHYLVGGDKNGTIYLVNGDAMGHLETPEQSSAAYRGSSIGGLFNFAVWGQGDNATVYMQGGGDVTRSFTVSGGSLRASSAGTSLAPVKFGRIGMTISANGSQDGILWQTSGDPAQSPIPATLHAFDAADLRKELWNSDLNSELDSLGTLTKFVSPTVAGGKVFVPTSSNSVVVYGLLPSAVPQKPVISAIVNGASYVGDSIAPGEVVTLFGWNLGPQGGVSMGMDDSGLVSSARAGVEVSFDGVAAPILFASAYQLNVVAPFEIAPDSTTIQVNYQGLTSDPSAVPVTAAAPGIFSADTSGAGQGMIVNEDGTLNGSEHPAPHLSVITLYVTGVGQTSPAGRDGAVPSGDELPSPAAAVSAQAGGQDAPVLEAKSVRGTVQGIIAVRIRIPDAAPDGPAVPLAVQVGDQNSQPGLTVAIGR